MIELKKTDRSDAEELFELRRRAFQPLLDKYRDEDTNPAAESFEYFLRWFSGGSDCYFITVEEEHVGVIRVAHRDETTCRISPVCILPEHQNKGYAGQAMLAVEKLYPAVKRWELDTIKQEEGLLRFYERLGYRQTGKEREIKEGMTLVYYEKNDLKG